MKIVDEFKDFAMKGNVIDMAVGIVIGVAFGRIVSSVVNDILMPPIGVLIGGVNFSDLKFIIKEATDKTPAVSINYGNFIQVVFDFIIIAFSMFIVIKAMNVAKRQREKDLVEEKPIVVEESKDLELLSEIRDLLKK
ncbi:MAG: large-conductance mechanosensitive channel protein MscL [Flavobacteriales bacterium]|nr:large-conductance mechanosensitive channel protein MscL [Flavobacteriales bacterium]